MNVRFTSITDTNPTACSNGVRTVPLPRLHRQAATARPGSAPCRDRLTGTPVCGAGVGIWNAVLNNVGKTASPSTGA